jgi:hypothetical protein
MLTGAPAHTARYICAEQISDLVTASFVPRAILVLSTHGIFDKYRAALTTLL